MCILNERMLQSSSAFTVPEKYYVRLEYSAACHARWHSKVQTDGPQFHVAVWAPRRAGAAAATAAAATAADRAGGSILHVVQGACSSLSPTVQ